MTPLTLCIIFCTKGTMETACDAAATHRKQAAGAQAQLRVGVALQSVGRWPAVERRIRLTVGSLVVFDEALTSDAKLRAAAVLAQLGIDDEETSAYLLRAVGSL